MNQIKVSLFTSQISHSEKSFESTAVKAKKTELTNIQTENHNLIQKR